jgi:hypothetical protein
MPETVPPCSNFYCGHPYTVHTEQYGACRVTKCACLGYLPPVEAVVDPDPEPQRLVIEIPEGFAVTIQLVPIETA